MTDVYNILDGGTPILYEHLGAMGTAKRRRLACPSSRRI
jgi:hypothetical protein